MTKSERQAFWLRVHEICDRMTSKGIGLCTRGSKRHSKCNALNCAAYAKAVLERDSGNKPTAVRR